ncbi:hypothetical protein HK097_005082 [Rhizophlyctis rosea]|uniref:ribonuclease H n=1 Tax=Rhizophlyctis rosea TaxID=64517 RepID=A0AAD5X9U3_9FUNG|nr:hypothetical protein HK097_005082 [Rhizophlyctis rosea]
MPALLQFGTADTEELPFSPKSVRSPTKSIPANAEVILVDVDEEMRDAQDETVQTHATAPEPTHHTTATWSSAEYPDQGEWLKVIPVLEPPPQNSAHGTERRNSALPADFIAFEDRLGDRRGSTSSGHHLDAAERHQGPSNGNRVPNPYQWMQSPIDRLTNKKHAKSHSKLVKALQACIQEWAQGNTKGSDNAGAPKSKKAKNANAAGVQPKAKKVKGPAQPAKKRKVQASVPALRNGGAGKVSLNKSEVNQQNVLAGGLITVGAEMIDTQDIPIYADGSFRIYTLVDPVTGHRVKVPAGGIGVVFPNGNPAGRDQFGDVVEVQSSADAEIMSCLRAVQKAPNNCNLIIYTDCVYVCTGLHGKKQDRELFIELRKAISMRVGAVHFRWVKGHANDAYNNKADQLAADGTKRCIQKLKAKYGYQNYVELGSKQRKVVTVTNRQLAQQAQGPSGDLTGQWMHGPNGQMLNMAPDARGVYTVIASLPGADGNRDAPHNGTIVIQDDDDEDAGQEIEYVTISDDEEAEGIARAEGANPVDSDGSDMDLEDEEETQEEVDAEPTGAFLVDAISSDDEPSEEGESPASDVPVGEKRKRA